MSLGVSCSAHRNALARINSDGVFLEELDRRPDRFLPKALAVLDEFSADGLPRIRLDQPIQDICRQLDDYRIGTLVLLSGPMIVGARHCPCPLSRPHQGPAGRCPST